MSCVADIATTDPKAEGEKITEEFTKGLEESANQDTCY